MTQPKTMDSRLSALVNQFADPFAFVRELVQNSIDAGSNEVDLTLGYDDEQRLMTLTVQDYGCGMDRQTIVTRLTRMFSSAKDGDLTKIGRFGIGFVSVFAVLPDLVCVETARLGEAWQLWIHPDLRYELFELQVPVEGTCVKVFKHCSRESFMSTRRQVKTALRRWCAFVEPEIRLDTVRINRDFSELSPFQVTKVTGAVRMVVGYERAKKGRVRYYNRGLAVFEEKRSSPDHIGARVDSPGLEHTVSRDQILRDEHFEQLQREMEALATDALPRVLFERLEAQTLQSELVVGPEGRVGGLAASAYLRSFDPGKGVRSVRLPIPDEITARRVVPCLGGEPISLQRAHELRLAGRLLLASQESPVTQLLRQQGVSIVDTSRPFATELVQALPTAGALPGFVGELFAQPQPVSVRSEFDVLRTVFVSLVPGFTLEFGNFSYPESGIANRIALRQEQAFDLTPLCQPAAEGRDRVLVVNAQHEQVRPLLELAAVEPELATYLLVRLCSVTLHSAAECAAQARAALEIRWTRLSA